MKRFFDFINEAKLKGTKGVSDEYIADVDRRARIDTAGAVSPNQIMMLVMRVTDLTIGDIVDVRRYFENRLNRDETTRVRERFSQLEELAESVIRSNYGAILDNVDLDIKLVGPMGVSDFMDENSSSPMTAKPKLEIPKSKDKDNDNDKDKEYKPKKNNDIDDDIDIEVVKSGIDKRKIANSIIQGEAKNTKNILHTEEVKSGLRQIFGDRKATDIFSLWDQITKMANKLDWQIPIEDKARMMEDQPIGMAGACACEWPDKPEATEEQKNDILDSLDNDDDDDDDCDGGDCEFGGADESIEELFSQGNPKIKAVGIDFPMLLHETVKGIYEMIAAVAIPEDAKVATLVQKATSSFMDEAEDFRYGPYIAADIRDFIFKNNKSLEYPNIREFVFGRLMSMPDDEFFDTIKKILQSKLDGRDNQSVRSKIDNIIDDVISDIKKWELGEVMGHDNENDDDKSDDDKSDDYKSDNEFDVPSTDVKMGKVDLQKAMDAALDDGDMELFKKLGKEYSKRF